MIRRLSIYLVTCAVCLGNLHFFVDTAEAGKKPYVAEERTPRRIRLLRPAEQTPESQLIHADQLRERGRLRRAQRQYRALVRYWPNSPEAPYAQFAYAQVLHERGRYVRAHEEYLELLSRYAGMIPHSEVLEEKFDIATVLKDRVRGNFLFFPGFHAPERALPVLESIVTHGPRWERAAKAQLLIAQIKEETGDLEAAVFAYERVETRHAGTPQAEEAAFGKARTLYALSNKYPRHLDGAETAMHILALVIQRYPDSESTEEAREQLRSLQLRIEEIEFEKALYYDRKAREPAAAILIYELFLQRFPQSEHAPEATKRLAKLREKHKGTDEP